MNSWDVMVDAKLLLNRLHEINKKENEIVHELNMRFQQVL